MVTGIAFVAETSANPGTGGQHVRALAVTEDEDGMRLDRWFKRRIPTLSLSHLNKIVRTGQVRIDGARVKTATRVQAGQSVRVPPLELASQAAAGPSKPAISRTAARELSDMVLFEDRDLLVLNKPFGLAVQGGSGTHHHIDGMLASMPNERGDRPVLVHRLDRDTAGVLLVAKTRKMAADLGELFRSRQTRKTYWALVAGVPKPAQGRISLYLAKGEGMGDARGKRAVGADQLTREKMRVARHGDTDAQHSVTYYATVDRVPNRLAWLSLRPITGRTHQLRAHTEAIGHPILGDPKYGQTIQQAPSATPMPVEFTEKLHLLARRLELPHPRGGLIDVTAPLPPHMALSFDMLGFDLASFDPIIEAPE